MTATADDRPTVDVDDPFLATGDVADPESLVGQPGRGDSSRSVTLAVSGVALCILSALLLSLVAELSVVGALRQGRDQQVQYAQLRESLAKGIAPTGQTDLDGKVLALGTPVALLRIPAIGVDQVAVEGTTSGVLMSGPGHRRDTVLPGQPGTSVLMGRQAAYGGPFANLASLKPGDAITITTGQGEYAFKVSALRRPGDPVPAAPAAGKSRLTLITADGTPYLASSTLRVDAELVGDAGELPSRVFGTSALAPAERPMAGDPSAWISLVFWAQGLVLVALGVVWASRRWGRWQTWVVGVPVLALFGLGVAGQIARLLPNLI